MTQERDAIDVVGADANNLAQVQVRIPYRALTAIVGVSGSGKSSLVEQTIAAEAAERMHRFLDIDQPALRGTDVHAHIGPLPPILFAGQRAFRASARTTLGTSTGLLRLLRRLFVRFADVFADDVNEPVPNASPASFSRWLKAFASGRAVVWAVPVLNHATSGEAAVKRLVEAGVKEVVVRSETDRGAKAQNGTRVLLAKFKPLRADLRHSIEACIGEVDLGKVTAAKLEALLDAAWAAAPGAVTVELKEEARAELRRPFMFGLDSRVHRVHPRSPVVYAKPDPHRLTFNAPTQPESGACPSCSGLGMATELDEDALVAQPTQSMHCGALSLWTEKNYRYVNIQHVTIEGLRGREGFDPDMPWRKLSDRARALVLGGTRDLVQGIDPRTKKKSGAPREFEGFRNAIVERAGANTLAGQALRELIHEGRCRACNGTRWSIQTRALRVAEWSVDRLLALSLSALEAEARAGRLAEKCPPDARSLVANIARTAASMVSVGVGHLSGDRGMADVSDGESRRTRLAGVLTSRLAGLLLILDEPARGLHEQDLTSLGDAIVQAAQLHTVVISEHRQRVVARADHLVELGPGAGPNGGHVTYAGHVQGTEWDRLHRSPTSHGPSVRKRRWLEIDGANIHNVRDATVKIPLGEITCIAGVSGSGKSSLVRGALVPALMRALPKELVDAEDFRTRSGTWDELRGAEDVGSLCALDQAPASAHRRSLVATFLGIAERLRKVYGAQSEAERLGLGASDFSANSGKGRCPRCLGLGSLDDGLECPVCGGLRFGLDALSVRVHGLSFADLLVTPVEVLCERALTDLFEPAVLASMTELGVGHLSLGRSLDTLSGGEVQRVRIARALAKRVAAGTLFVLDEPAGGLHPTDVERLHRALRHIVENGKNTVVLVEHDPHLLAVCDHIVEFGPGAGPNGGRVIAKGSPYDVSSGDTPTGLALRGLPRFPATRRTAASQAAVVAKTRDAALRVRAEIRQVSGEDIEVADDDEGPISPAGVPDMSAMRRPLEIADLDASVLSVLIDAARPDVETQLESAARVWGTTPLRLQIHPLLDAMATWGTRIPRSVIADAEKHRAAMGLPWNGDAMKDVRSERASGKRFDVPDPAKRRGALRDALAVGGGYLELVDSKGKVQASVCARLMNLDLGLVGPRHATPADFRRLDPRGACPMCCGAGVVAQLERSLLVARETGRVSDDKSLDRRAGEILKGVWRSDMVPFFRRLAEEGLWDPDVTWRSLGPDAAGTVMHGFWLRPSHGTFLKVGSGIDGSEVNHWLRWDGLVTAIRTQLHRSKDTRWRDAVQASSREVTCPKCRGSGLAPTAGLLGFGGNTLDVWARKGTLGSFLDGLEALPDLPSRAARDRQRLVACLAPLRKLDPPLSQAAAGPAVHEVWARATERFAFMPLATE